MLATIDTANESAPLNPRTTNLLLGDFNLRFYPFSTRRFRPHVSAGLGLANWDYSDDLGHSIRDTVVTFPLSVGISWRYSEELVFRFDFQDAIISGSGPVVTSHQLTYVGSLEYHFGSPRRSYWPWSPGAY